MATRAAIRPDPGFICLQCPARSRWLALLIEKAKGWAAALVTLVFVVWLIALKLPEAVAVAPQITKLTSWIGFVTGMSEEVAIAAGAWMLHGLLSKARGLNATATSWTVARLAFGLACVQFGLSHFCFADFTANMIPEWIPARLPLAYITGAGHLAAGLAILAGPLLPKVWRLAAALEAVMMASFVILVHIPMIIASKPDGAQLSWTLIFIATLLASAASAITAQACRYVEAS